MRSVVLAAIAAICAAAQSDERCPVTESGAGPAGKAAQLTADTVCPAVVKAQYAVRGPLLLRALEIEEDLKTGQRQWPFERVVKCNIGNPQSLGQKPITFTRQVLSLLLNPELIEEHPGLYKPDVLERAKLYLTAVGSVGAYSESQGIPLVRDEVAKFIADRDGGVVAKPGNIFLTNGASQAVQFLLQAMIRDENDAILVPLPQYPMYSALTALQEGHMAGYHLGEATGTWTFDMAELRRALAEARNLGKTVRALVVINPGNPTGSSLTVDEMKQVVQFCEDENLVLLADEVYQSNVYTPERPFVSFRRVLHEVGILGQDGNMRRPFQLASFHSVSKGTTGECGLRGGYVEFLGFQQSVRDLIYKLASIGLCSNVPGQVAVGLMVNPPKLGDPSHAQYAEERDAVFNSLARRAQKLERRLNALPGITCAKVEGAMYAFPQIALPQKFVDHARAAAQEPDALYALQLLEGTGLVVIPGSGFGQREGTFHIRTTFLPPEAVMDEVLDRLGEFHTKFMTKWQ